MNIVPKLNLNKHPKDCENLSLISAKNVRVADDMSCLTNEEGVTIRGQFNADLASDFKGDWDILGYIPCNNEVVLFVRGIPRGETEPRDFIYRYDEKEDNVLLANSKWKWSGGKIKGTFTYNVENNLIIAIAEYGVDGIDIPLKTINLGKLGEDSDDDQLDDKYYSITPELKLPYIGGHDYIAGSAYKGWYYFFIRFKINKTDYTQWFGFGYPVFVDSLERQNIIRYCYGQKRTFSDGPNSGRLDIIWPKENIPDDGFCSGCSDTFSNNTDIASTTFKIEISGLESFSLEKKTGFEFYQIGVVCASKSYTKSWRTSDINTNNSDNSFVYDIKQLLEIDLNSLIDENYNYFNVKNIINYKNRLYISNYKEHSSNIDLSEFTKNISINLKYKYYNPYSIVSTSYLFMTKGNYANSQNTNQYFTTYADSFDLRNIAYYRITLADILSVPSYYEVKITNKQTNASAKDGVYKAGTVYLSSSKTVFTNNDFATNILPASLIFRFPDDNLSRSIEVSYNGIKRLFDVSEGTFGYSNFIINPEINFYDRLKNTTLLPGEVYNFYVHFVDKYGHTTNGYRLNNEITITDPNGNIGYPLPIYYNDLVYYFLVDEDKTLGEIRTELRGYEQYNLYPYYDGKNLSGTAINISGTEVYNALNETYNMATVSETSALAFYNFKPYQVSNSARLGNQGPIFGVYKNNNGDRLFRIPNDKYDSAGNNLQYYLNLSYTDRLPEGYIGWYISYEKFESLSKVNGILSRNDARTDKVDLLPNTANMMDSDAMYLYSSTFDISDNLNLSYNVLKIEELIENTDATTRIAKDFRSDNAILRNFTTKFVTDWNKSVLKPREYVYSRGFTSVNDAPRWYPMPEYKLIIADDAKNDRVGLGTALEIKDSYNLFEKDKIRHYNVRLYNMTNNLYMSTNKELLRLTPIYYDVLVPHNVMTGYNGLLTYDGVLVYENPGLAFDTTTFVAHRRRGRYTRYIPIFANNELRNGQNPPFVQYLQFPLYDTYPYESKRFNNPPTPIVYPIKTDSSSSDDNSNKYYFAGTIVEPKNSIDLFVNPQGSQDDFNIKIFTNYRKEILSVEHYNKTVRRSNIIQDESRINAWRTFPVEGYKNITENKGIITNLVGIGTYLLVHTEHSLFMFNTDSTLKTQDKDIQLSQPDAFEVDYTEVFTSDFGYGGLQDDKAFAVDQFGYIFYNNDFNHFYQFDNGQLKVIDADIIQFLNKFKPINIRIANDKLHSRLLIKMDIPNIGLTQKSEVISYHYDLGNFVSLHDYYFEEAFNTKTQIYLLRKDGWDNPNKKTNLYYFDDRKNYGFIYDTIINTNNLSESYKSNTVDTYKSFVSIIINSEYQVIKLIEFLKYNLRKIKKDNDAFTFSPVEEMKVPYAGDLIRIYNDQCDSGDLDVSVTEYNPGNYTKPWYELGNWNFNYFRNNINNLTPDNGDVYTRLFGNYFVVRFIFNNDDNLRIELEEVDGSVVKNRKL